MDRVSLMPVFSSTSLSAILISEYISSEVQPGYVKMELGWYSENSALSP